MQAMDSAQSQLIQIAERVRAAAADATPLRIRGGGTKDFHGLALQGELLDTRALAGVVSYEPSELVVTVRAGTPLAEVEALLAAQGQCLAFEPPHFEGADGRATVGGMVASGLSGPSRASVGAVRDFMLGLEMINGQGELLRYGGQVMKNVAGYDVSRLMAGSWGTLGLITEVSLKVLPVAPAEATLRFECTQQQALDWLNAWGGQPLPLNASCWLQEDSAAQGVLYLRLRGARAAVQAACGRLGGERMHSAAADWQACREHQLPCPCRRRLRPWRCLTAARGPWSNGTAHCAGYRRRVRWAMRCARWQKQRADRPPCSAPRPQTSPAPSPISTPRRPMPRPRCMHGSSRPSILRASSTAAGWPPPGRPGQRLAPPMRMRHHLHLLTDRHRTVASNRTLGLLLAFNAGAVNAGGFLLVHSYTSHMTGFVSLLADNLVLGNTALVLSACGALLAFLCGAAATSLLVNWARHHRLRSSYALPLLLEAALMLLFGVLGAAMLAWPTPFAVPLAVLLLSFIMGLQNATVTKMSSSQIRTTHMTGVITDLGMELGRALYWNRHGSPPEHRVHANHVRLRLFAGLLSMFLLGGIAGALGFRHLGFVFVVPLAVVLCLLSLPPLWADRARLPLLLGRRAAPRA